VNGDRSDRNHAVSFGLSKDQKKRLAVQQQDWIPGCALSGWEGRMDHQITQTIATTEVAKHLSGYARVALALQVALIVGAGAARRMVYDHRLRRRAFDGSRCGAELGLDHQPVTVLDQRVTNVLQPDANLRSL
jgi:hypothetical protein